MIRYAPMTQPFTAWLDAQAARIDGGLERVAAQLAGECPAGVAEAAHYALLGEGKRLRPALCLAAFHAVRPHQNDDAVVDLACTIELLHTYSLIHDDLPCMDDDALRRGRPTTHVVYGSHTALFAGAALIPFAFRWLMQTTRNMALSPVATTAAALDLARACGGGGMVGGQSLDLAAEGRATSLDDLEKLHLAKTGELMAAAARLGGYAGAASPDVLHALRVYGRCLGLAFQIADDLLDLTGTARQVGKTTGKDRALAKATFPALIGLDGARQRAQHEVQKALAVLDATGIRTWELEGIARFAIERER
jgi:geranylgeranyl pyrophosphate synthase